MSTIAPEAPKVTVKDPRLPPGMRAGISLTLFAPSLEAVAPVFDRRSAPRDMTIRILYPPIEHHANFAARVDPSELVHGCRCFNPSIARWHGRLWMAYRHEAFDGRNRIGIAVLADDLHVQDTQLLDLPDSVGVHWEDPRLTVAGDRLYLLCAHIEFGVPPICRQRLWRVGGDLKLCPAGAEVDMPIGRALAGIIEKNWVPMELPSGGLAIVYSQRPHEVIRLPDCKGWRSPGILDLRLSEMLSGRTPPLRLPSGDYLSFHGGHVKHDFRGGRYYFGAHLFSGKEENDFRIIAATPEPLCWGSEGSPTLYSGRPHSGYPCCVFPAGLCFENDELRTVLVSAGVNDSYCVLFRFHVEQLLGKMLPVDQDGHFIR